MSLSEPGGPAAPPDWINTVAGDRIAIGGKQLRHWAFSETWRIRWADGTTTIVKRGSGEMAAELDAYERLVVPYRIPAPELLASHRGDGFVVMMLSDVGSANLEDRPSTAGYEDAARLLAHLRQSTTGRLNAEPVHRADDVLDSWARAATALASLRPDLAGALDGTPAVLGPELRRLDGIVAPALVHGDFEAKNLVVGPSGLVAVDWDAARVSSYLVDLYQLIRATGRAGGDTSGLIRAYAGRQPDADLDRQITVGGLVWVLGVLPWILEEGVHGVPEMLTWIDELVDEARRLTDNLRP